MLKILLEALLVALIEGHKKSYIRPKVYIQNPAYPLSSISLGMTLRVSPWVHQAGGLNAISPISMKLGQFKGSTLKLKMTN